MNPANKPAAAREVTIQCGETTLAGALFIPEMKGFQRLPCMIVCHGAFEYKENFFHFCDCLCANNICAVTIDMPGHGQSSGEKFHVHIDHWVDAIQSTTDFLADEKAIDPARIGIFGFSSGGTAAIEAAIADPRIKILVTLDATIRNYLNFKDTVIFKTLNMVGKIKRMLTGSDLRLNLTHLLKTISAAYDASVNETIVSNPKLRAAYASFPFPGAAACAFVDTIERVSRLAIPTLIMHGRQDQVDPPETAKLFYDRLACVKDLKIIEPSGHCGHLDSSKDQVVDLSVNWIHQHLSL